MQKAYYLLPLLFLTFLCTSVRAQSIPLQLNAASVNQLTLTETAPGTYAISTSGLDPNVATVPLTQAYDHGEVYVISFEYEAAGGLDDFQMFYGAPFSAQRRIEFGSLAASSTFRTFKAFMKIEAPVWEDDYAVFRFDFGVTAGQNITVRNLQLRAPTSREVIPFSLEPTMRNQAPTTANGNGGFDITTNGGDPWVRSTLITEAYNPDSVYVLSFDYTSTSGINNNFQIFYGQPDHPTRRALYPALPPAATKTTFTAVLGADVSNWDQFYDRFRFDWGTMAGLDIQVSNFMLREPTNAESKLIIPPAETVMLELNTGFTSSFLTATEPSPMTYELTTVGPDPWIRTKPVTVLYDTDESYIFEFEYKTPTEYNEFRLFFGPPINAAQTFATGTIPAASDWTTYTINTRLVSDGFQAGDWTDFRLDFGRDEDASAEKTISIRNLKIRKPTAQELIDEENSDKFLSRALNTKFQEYLSTTFPGFIDSVTVTETEVIISGNIAAGSGLQVAEVLPEAYGFDQTDFLFTSPLNQDADGDFTVTVDRFTPRNGGDGDRLYSRWVIVEELAANDYAKLSPLAWATDLCFTPTYNLPEIKASSLKGIDGLTPTTLYNLSDLTDLNVTSMKINLLLNAVFSQQGTGGASHTFNGKTYGINQNFVAGLDARVKACYDAGIKVAFVLLLPINIGNPALKEIFVHPDAVGWSGSPYTMANVTSASGVEHYTALIDYLSQRYSRTDGLYGHADQWIIHNEVDAHQSWTYAGQKPVELYTQIYDRSMRMVHYTIRKHNPTAKVFSSFTKHWNSKAVNQANFRSVDILNTLNDLSRMEGDYEWGIGWHSYPTNLFNPLVWEDSPTEARFDFGTPQITPKNIEMIDAYVRQVDVLYRGKKVRTVLLSENGFNSNTATNANANETTQAAALAYFWKKVYNRLPSIENIQLHRWVDHPNEAGLHFGLWTVQDGTIDGFGQKKKSWDVWNAAGTMQEDSIFLPYKSTIGITDWSDIQNVVTTETTPYQVFMNILNCDNDLTDVLVSFNGEQRIPQADGTVNFFNVASNVDQPLVIRKGGVLLVTDTLRVSNDLELTFDLQAVADLAAAGVSATEVALSWADVGAGAGAGFVIERSADGAPFAALATVTDTAYTDTTVISGTDYTYRVAALLNATTSSCFSDPVTVTAPFLLADYRNGDLGKPDNNKLAPQLRLRNESAMPVALDDITVRYWFTAENLAPLNFYVDYAALGNNNVSGNFVALENPRAGANHYLEMGFPATYEVPAGGNTGDIKTRIAKTDYTDFAEADDYSYADVGSYMETTSITVYRNGELIWGTEPSEVAPVVSLKVLHKNTNNATNNSIRPELKLINDGNVPVDYAALTLRYWFTPEGSATVNQYLDHADLGSENVTRQIGTAGNLAGGSRYLEVGFSPGLGQLGAASHTGEMKFRLAKTDWSSFDETDDHSYGVTGNNFLENVNITAYLNGALVWGTEPGAAPLAPHIAPPTEQFTAPAYSAQLFPNPAVGYTDLHWSGDIEAIDQIHLLNVQGQRLPVRTETAGTRLRIHLGELPDGLYILSGAVNGTTVTKRIIVRR